jgi:anti-sigma28 factor (negative regulator of flagellin synthesis)
MKIGDNWQSRVYDPSRVQGKDSNAVDKSSKANSLNPIDKTDISDRAKQLQMASKMIQESVEEIKAMPAVREEAVTAAKERVQLGYYDKKEVLDDIAGVLTNHLSSEKPVNPDEMATDVIANISPEDARYSKKDLEGIKKNIETGMYTDNIVIEKVAHRISTFLKGIPEE